MSEWHPFGWHAQYDELPPLVMKGESEDGMPEFETQPQAYLFLDFDGVVNFLGGVGSDLGDHRKNEAMGFTLKWSQEVVERLSELPVYIVWLTTWREHTKLLNEILGFGPWRTSWLNWNSGWHGKYNALKNYINNGPELPFIWIDDDAIGERYKAEDFSVPNLTIEPNCYYGLMEHHFDKIEKFLGEL